MSVIKDEYISDIVTRHDLLPISFLKKSAYTGSRGKLRYKIEKSEIQEGEGTKKILILKTWKTPFCFEKTPEEEIESEEFPFEYHSLDLIVDSLNQKLEAMKN